MPKKVFLKLATTRQLVCTTRIKVKYTTAVLN